MYKILIVEDDNVIANAVQKYIESWGHNVKCILNFQNIISNFIEYNPHLVLLDISLPFFNGYHWCSEIRKISDVPIIFVSSTSDKMDIVMAVNMGWDDFIAKPFDLEVLNSKIQALLRRCYNYSGNMEFIEYNGVKLDKNNASICYKEKTIDLTKNESKIINTLLEAAGKIVSRDTLMLKLWETDNFIDDNTLTVNVTRLRNKLKTIGLSDFIVTKKGLGYMVK